MNVLLHCTLIMRGIAVRKLSERVAPLCTLYVCSHLCHFDTTMPLGGLVSAPTAGPRSWVEGTSHTHRRKKNKKRGPLDPSVRHPYVCANRMWEERRRPAGEAF